MNEFAGFSKPVFGGYHAMIRKAQDASAKPVLGDGGVPIIYATEAEALRAVVQHLTAYFNGALRRDGAKVSARMEADKIFRLGKKPIPVERRRASA